MGLLILLGIILIFAAGWFMGVAHERGDVYPEEYYHQIKSLRRQGLRLHKKWLRKKKKGHQP